MSRLLRFLRSAILNKTERPRRSPRRRAFYRGPARDESYKAFIRRQPCCCGCGRGSVEAAHTGHDGGIGIKSSDYSVIPLSWRCHRELHQIGRATFERLHGIDLDVVAEGFFTEWSARQ